jgi:hypothetical protein
MILDTWISGKSLEERRDECAADRQMRFQAKVLEDMIKKLAQAEQRAKEQEQDRDDSQD